MFNFYIYCEAFNCTIISTGAASNYIHSSLSDFITYLIALTCGLGIMVHYLSIGFHSSVLIKIFFIAVKSQKFLSNYTIIGR